MTLNPVPNWPVSLDSLPDPTQASYEDDVGYELDLLLQKHNAILEAIEAKLGIGATTPDTIHKILKVISAGTSAYGYYGPVMLGQHGPLGTAAATLDVSSIDGNFRSLIVQAQVRGATAAGSTGCVLRINNDSGSNYDYQSMAAVAAGQFDAEAFAQSNISLGNIPAASAGAGLAAQVDAQIANYAVTTFNKTIRARLTSKLSTSSGNLVVSEVAGFWRSTAAITRVTLVPLAGNFEVGSVLTVWGMPAV